jgi:hypothetical protein
VVKKARPIHVTGNLKNMGASTARYRDSIFVCGDDFALCVDFNSILFSLFYESIISDVIRWNIRIHW